MAGLTKIPAPHANGRAAFAVDDDAAVRSEADVDHGHADSESAVTGSNVAKPVWTLDQIVQWYDRENNARHWTPETIQFSFATCSPESSFSPFTEAQRQAARDALVLYSDIANIKFVEVADGSRPDTNSASRKISFENSDVTDGAIGKTIRYYRSEGGGPFHLQNAIVGIQPADAGDDYDLGSRTRKTLIHEIGHALSLPHPGDYGDGNNNNYDSKALFFQDSRQYTVMSYFDASFTGGDHDGSNAATPLLLDIASMQSKYGVNMATRTGDTTYGFHSTAGRGAFDFALNPEPVVAIWDAGGTDTIDLSGYAAAQRLNLESGAFSDVGGLVGNLAIAYGATVENGIGGAGDDLITGNAGANVLTGGAGRDLLAGLNGNDVLRGGIGNDTLVGGLGDDTLDGGDGIDAVSFEAATAALRIDLGRPGAVDFGPGYGRDTLVSIEHVIGSAFNDKLTGGASNDVLEGRNGNDILDGATGADTMTGGLGNDLYYVDNSGDQEIEAINGGLDAVYATATTVLGDNVEVLRLQGTGNINGTGNALGNQITGTSGANVIMGGAGNDILGGFGGNDTLDGGVGADHMSGGDGNDVYYVDVLQDVTSESANGGFDIVYATVHTTLAPNVEVLRLIEGNGVAADAPLNGAGNALDNLLTGNAGNNLMRGFDGGDNLGGLFGNDTLEGGNGDDTLTGHDGNDILNGGAGIDQMTGGTGNDLYYVDDVADLTLEAIGAGNDAVYSTIDLVLAANIETLRLQGTGNLKATGNGLGNTISGTIGANLLNGLGGNDNLAGLDGNDTLDGGIGADTLAGGQGDDVYAVDSFRDFVYEGVNAGIDTVNSVLNATLGNNVEILNLVGLGDLRGDGNALGNIITGNAGGNRLRGFGGADDLRGLVGNDTLDGGAGTDTLAGGDGNDLLDGGLDADAMTGGAGNDLYFVDHAADQTIEAFGGGTDAVYATITITLASNIEVLRLQGTGDLGGTGNGIDNTISGTSGDNAILGLDGNDTLSGLDGADTLDGGHGNDWLVGGAGDDVYITDSLIDRAIENAGQGIDTVISVLNATLAANVENLTLVGDAALRGDGNTLDNAIVGNAGDNRLRGFAGADTIDGGTGADTLVGGLGRDTLDVGTDSAVDVVVVEGVADSTGAERDAIANFVFGTDKIDLAFASPLSIGATVQAAALSDADFDASLTAVLADGPLAAFAAVLVTTDGTDVALTGHSFLVIDVNGLAGYQSGEDFVAELIGAKGDLTLDAFI